MAQGLLDAGFHRILPEWRHLPWTTSTISAAISTGQAVTATIETSNDGAAVADSHEVELEDGTNAIDLTGQIADSRYIRVTLSFASGGTHDTPTVSAVGFQGEEATGQARRGFRILSGPASHVRFCRPARGPMILGDN